MVVKGFNRLLLSLITLSIGLGIAGCEDSHDISNESEINNNEVVVIGIEEGPLPETLALFTDQIKSELGINVEFSTMPFTEQYQVEMRDLAIGKRFDVISVWPIYMGDMSPYLVPLSEIVEGGEAQAYKDMNIDSVLEGYRWVHYYDGQLYALQYDGDVKLLHARIDLLENPIEQVNFKEKYGYSLNCPTNYQEYHDMASFFTRPAEQLYGTAEIASFLSYFTFVDHYMGAGGHFFDPETMKPFPDRDLALKAIEQMFSMFQKDVAPPEATSMGIETVRNQLSIQKRTAFASMWPEVWKWSGDKNIVGDNLETVKSCLWPGGRPDMAGGRVLAITKNAKNKEAAYKVLKFFADDKRTAALVNDNKTWLDPYRKSHVQPENYSHLCQLKPERCEQFTSVIKETIDKGYPVLNIKGSGKYYEVIERNVTAIIAGELTPENGLQKMVEGLDDITDRLGRDRQINAYKAYVQRALVPKGLYPALSEGNE